MNFLFPGRDESRILIATSTAGWPEESWELLRGRRSTSPSSKSAWESACRTQRSAGFISARRPPIAFRDRLAELGAVTASTQVAVTHISHHVGATHEELEAYFRPYGMLVGYDGMLLGRA